MQISKKIFKKLSIKQIEKKLNLSHLPKFSPYSGLQVVKNIEGSEISLYFQANKIGCHSFMEDGR